VVLEEVVELVAEVPCSGDGSVNGGDGGGGGDDGRL
jgi:hypothetical protein